MTTTLFQLALPAVSVVLLSASASAAPQATPAPQTAELPGNDLLENVIHPSERLDASSFGPSVIESIEQALEREKMLALLPPTNPKARNGEHGSWIVPSRRFSEFARSGEHYATNKWGDPRIGVGFGGSVDVEGVWISGQGDAGAWARAVQVVAHRGGVEVARSVWFEDVDATPSWLALDFDDVDRIEFVAEARLDAQAWFGIDDLTFVRESDGAKVVVDFEDCEFGAKLSGSDYRGLAWETGTGPIADQGVRVVPPPQVPPGHVDGKGVEVVGGQSQMLGGSGSAPNIGSSFIGPRLGDAGAFSIPPDTVGAVGPTHFLASVNSNLSGYLKATGQRVLNLSLTSFFSVGGLGDPRVGFDPQHNRFIVLATNFNNRVYLAYSLTSDVMGSWFKTSVLVSQGADAARWPDYPTLGVDQNGIYFSCYMVPAGMSIFAVDKAPLLQATPALGTVTAFRNLPWEGAIQPCVTYGTPGSEYFISKISSTGLRIRRLDPPLSAPTLTTVGTAVVASNSAPPNAPALGSNTNLDTLDGRLINSVYRNGSIWTTHGVSSSSRAAVRWYQINPSPITTQQTGTINDASLHYFHPSIAVNANNDVLIGFTGSNASQFAATYLTGRKASDPAGETAVPQLTKAGEGSYNNVDGNGTNRWGDYSLCSVDPADDTTLWSIQEYARVGNDWGTWINSATFGPSCPPVIYCTSKLNSQLCQPLIGFVGQASFTDTSPFDITGTEFINNKNGLLFYGLQANGAAFQGGHLCAKLPVVRTSVQSSGGNPPPNDCSGTYSFDFNAYLQSGADPNLLPATTVFAQYWARDPLDLAGFSTSLSDAVQFEICP